MRCVAIIPARGGSKRIPRKNIRAFNGRPMICWPIQVALQSGLFESVIVSTDDEQIADVAIKAGADVPFLRNAALSDDNTGVVPVLRDVLRRHWSDSSRPDLACLIYATAPFLTSGDLKRGLRSLEETSASFAISICQFRAPIDRALIIERDLVQMRCPDNFGMRSQDFPESYHDAGQFCWGRSDNWLDGPGVFDASTAPILLPRSRVQDIDNLEDWEYAELMARVIDRMH